MRKDGGGEGGEGGESSEEQEEEEHDGYPSFILPNLYLGDEDSSLQRVCAPCFCDNELMWLLFLSGSTAKSRYNART